MGNVLSRSQQRNRRPRRSRSSQPVLHVSLPVEPGGVIPQVSSPSEMEPPTRLAEIDATPVAMESLLAAMERGASLFIPLKDALAAVVPIAERSQGGSNTEPLFVVLRRQLGAFAEIADACRLVDPSTADNVHTRLREISVLVGQLWRAISDEDSRVTDPTDLLKAISALLAIFEVDDNVPVESRLAIIRQRLTVPDRPVASRESSLSIISDTRNTTINFGRDVVNNNWNQIVISGAILEGTNELTTGTAQLQLVAGFPPLASNMSVTVTLPPQPAVFHGRDEFVNNAIALLISSGTSQIAILGSGGIGKTSVALVILHDSRLIERFGGRRYFVSCEAFVNGDSIVEALARLFDLHPSKDLLTTLIAYLADGPPMVLVLDNIETVWLVQNVATASAVEGLLGTLSQVPTLSLIITCRGIVLPQSVKWSNAGNARLHPFSLEAALKTFEERSGHQIEETEIETASILMNAVDRMPLAVSLLGQLAERGTSVSELLDLWNEEHTALLSTRGPGRMHNLDVSVELSISMLGTADPSRESLHLLSLCSMLPDGLYPHVFKQLRSRFKQIYRARDFLSAYALGTFGADRVLRILSPIRHLVLEHHAALPDQRDTLYTIYLNIGDKLPITMDENFKRLAEAPSLEMGNLSTLLLSLVHQPSQRIVECVVKFTEFSRWQYPTTVVASALLTHVEAYPRWKADCLRSIGHAQLRLDEYRSAIASLSTATQLYIDVGKQEAAVADCKCNAAQAHRLLHEYNHAEVLLGEACTIYKSLADVLGEAQCRLTWGRLLRQQDCFAAAIDHLSAARKTYDSLHQSFGAAQCSQALGSVYIGRGDINSADIELQAAMSVFRSIGDQLYLSQCARVLVTVLRGRAQYSLAEQLLDETKDICQKRGDRYGLAACHFEFGFLRRNQGRLEDAIPHFNSAHQLYVAIGASSLAEGCQHHMEVTVGRLANVTK